MYAHDNAAFERSAPAPGTGTTAREPAAPLTCSAPDFQAHGGPSAASAWLFAMDEIDYGVLLLDANDVVVHANFAARRELERANPLLLVEQRLAGRERSDHCQLRGALRAAAHRHQRCLVHVGSGALRIALAVVPAPTELKGGTAALAVMGRREACPQLTMLMFARVHGLTRAEARVLGLLSSGVTPAAIAAQSGLAVSTVRSQIGSIRRKTDNGSIRALTRQVALLPPLITSLRLVGAG